MNEKIRVLLIVPWYPDKNDINNPSRGSFFEEQFKQLCQIIDITVLVINIKYISDIKNIKDFWSIKSHKEAEFTIYKLNAIHIPKCIKCTSKYISYLIGNSLSALIKSVDIIHSHVLYPSGSIGFELSEKFKIPFILTEHISIFSLLIKNNYLYNIMMKTHYMTAVSNSLKKTILNEGRKQCKVIPNYIDTRKYHLSIRKNKLMQFIHISSMIPLKNVNKLLFGFKLFLKQTNLNARLVLLGGGSNIKEYKKLVNNIDIDKYVDFKGDVSNKVLRENLSLSDALIITSDVETFSVVGVEALASGIPVITTKCGGPEDYITSDTGILIKNRTAEEIAKSLIYYVNHKNEFNSLKIKQICFEKFDQSIIVEQLKVLYKKILLNYDS